MDLYEHQARQLFADHGIAVPDAEVVDHPSAAHAAAERLGGRVVVVVAGEQRRGSVKIDDD